MFYSKEGKKPHPCNTHENTHTCTKHMETHTPTNFKNYMYTRVRHIINAKPWWVLGLSVVRVTIRSLLRWEAVGVANKITQGLGLRFCLCEGDISPEDIYLPGPYTQRFCSVISKPNTIMMYSCVCSWVSSCSMTVAGYYPGRCLLPAKQTQFLVPCVIIQPLPTVE